MELSELATIFINFHNVLFVVNRTCNENVKISGMKLGEGGENSVMKDNIYQFCT